MKIGVIKDKCKRDKFFRGEEYSLVGRIVKANVFLPLSSRVGGHLFLRGCGVYVSKINNFCVYSFRSRGVLRSFKMSRHIFKLFVNKGLISGYKKGSW